MTRARGDRGGAAAGAVSMTARVGARVSPLDALVAHWRQIIESLRLRGGSGDAAHADLLATCAAAVESACPTPPIFLKQRAMAQALSVSDRWLRDQPDCPVIWLSSIDLRYEVEAVVAWLRTKFANKPPARSRAKRHPSRRVHPTRAFVEPKAFVLTGDAAHSTQPVSADRAARRSGTADSIAEPTFRRRAPVPLGPP